MTTLRVVFTVCSCALCPLVAAGGDNDIRPDVVIAEVNGTPITFGQFAQARADSMFQARNSFYQTQRKALEEYIDDYLLKEEAQRANLTVEQLLQQRVNGSLPKDPTDETLRVYYEGIETDQPFEAVRDKILDHLRQRRLQKARTAYMKSLRSQAQVTIKLSAPKAEIRVNDAPVRGDQRAPVTLVEFADYECPYCQQIEPELKKLEADFRGKVSLVYKDVPLPMHTHAQKAAEGARCAGVQGKYWEYHDLLFTAKEFGVPELKRHAKTLGLETIAFDKCLDSGEQAEKVKSDLAEAQRLGLSFTPSFFINGRPLEPGLRYDALRRELETELASLSSPPRQTAGQ